tara:strand:+ start:543 stop:644 length:102 start_codon:yes stop_codon:yes gene_type:complete
VEELAPLLVALRQVLAVLAQETLKMVAVVMMPL